MILSHDQGTFGVIRNVLAAGGIVSSVDSDWEASSKQAAKERDHPLW